MAHKPRFPDEPGPQPVPDIDAVDAATDNPKLDADAQLRILSACYDDIAEAQTAYDSKADAAKTAKKTLDAATSALLEKVREFTHLTPAPLPLFDAVEREADHADMVDAIARGGEPTP